TFLGRSTDLRCFSSRLRASAPALVMGMVSAMSLKPRSVARGGNGNAADPDWGEGRAEIMAKRRGRCNEKPTLGPWRVGLWPLANDQRRETKDQACAPHADRISMHALCNHAPLPS